ncbi:UDP-N-acetylmuramoyl-L-alanyl-D-glutamate--2,6-diaminopimelate ligase [Bacillus sp. CGMCC 1.16607]|uniref:UDP-N-acetylmuramoyl-L-alanyl-D-glutamate--2, 6-diaminopimelate ligase n=1 Tax=Bacillus sp. CGMCC 1.16607 TaxID=3351842 RepID=UPI0036341FA4
MNLHSLIDKLHLLVPYNGPNPEISSIENDNRKVHNGSLFICLKGYTVDGHDFARSAVERGAVAVLAERELNLDVPVVVVKDTFRAMAVLADAFYGQPSRKLHLIGITGTNGKTTTSHIIEKIFADQKKKTGLIGTMYTKILDEKFENKNTTPESLTLQKTFYEMVEKNIDMAVMEVSSHALHYGRVHGCDFDIAIFTNLSQDHLDYHETMENYKQAKGLLFSQLGNTFQHEHPKYAILNADDPTISDYQKMTAATIITYGIDQEADIKAENIKMTPKGTSFDVVIQKDSYPITIQLAGKFNIYNVLASIAAALASKISIIDIISSIEKISGVSGRFELVDAGQDFSVIVDYAHTPEALENVLKTIKQFAEKNIYVIIGCGGDRDKKKRPLMAKIACEYGSNAIFTSDNPRSEDPLSIIKDMEEGVQDKNYMSITDRKEAIRYAINQAKSGDIVLIAGKGHETYQTIGDRNFDFDDRLVAKEAIEER